mmetsp:Transcript_7761/g.19214  ORF Transcript_7761/g.19214 Transcript_7761/m.19214 type:complete len:141 (+) Transcript_7761:149-571(+)
MCVKQKIHTSCSFIKLPSFLLPFYSLYVLCSLCSDQSADIFKTQHIFRIELAHPIDKIDCALPIDRIELMLPIDKMQLHANSDNAPLSTTAPSTALQLNTEYIAFLLYRLQYPHPTRRQKEVGAGDSDPLGSASRSGSGA